MSLFLYINTEFQLTTSADYVQLATGHPLNPSPLIYAECSLLSRTEEAEPKFGLVSGTAMFEILDKPANIFDKEGYWSRYARAGYLKDGLPFEISVGRLTGHRTMSLHKIGTYFIDGVQRNEESKTLSIRGNDGVLALQEIPITFSEELRNKATQLTKVPLLDIYNEIISSLDGKTNLSFSMNAETSDRLSQSTIVPYIDGEYTAWRALNDLCIAGQCRGFYNGKDFETRYYGGE